MNRWPFSERRRPIGTETAIDAVGGPAWVPLATIAGLVLVLGLLMQVVVIAAIGVLAFVAIGVWVGVHTLRHHR